MGLRDGRREPFHGRGRLTSTIVLIHGAWMSPESWSGWKTRFEARGHQVLAPSWPFDDRPVSELRQYPDPRLAKIGIAEIVESYARVITGLAEPPVIIGHSFGGLFTQMLLDRGLGRAGVAIDPGPMKGVLPGPNALRANLPALAGWRSWSTVRHMSLGSFRWGWVHTLSADEQRAAYERYVVPTPGRIFAEVLLAPLTNTTRIGDGRHAPLLLIAGGLDRTVEPAMVRAAYARQRRSRAPTELREFPGRTHWICMQDGWEEVADAAIEWAERNVT